MVHFFGALQGKLHEATGVAIVAKQGLSKSSCVQISLFAHFLVGQKIYSGRQ
jgi:hypothetical protein